MKIRTLVLAAATGLALTVGASAFAAQPGHLNFNMTVNSPANTSFYFTNTSDQALFGMKVMPGKLYDLSMSVPQNKLILDIRQGNSNNGYPACVFKYLGSIHNVPVLVNISDQKYYTCDIDYQNSDIVVTIAKNAG